MNELQDQVARIITDYAGYADGVIFGILALFALRIYAQRRATPALWFAAMSATITTIIVASAFLGEDPVNTDLELWATRILIAILAMFPFCLYRFMRCFAGAPRIVHAFANFMTIVVVMWSFLLPSFPEEGAPRSTVFTLYVIAFMVHWVVLSASATIFFWREGRRQPGVARRRLRLLSAGSTSMAAALLIASLGSQQTGPMVVVTQLLALGSALMFTLGFAPPRLLRQIWRAQEQREFTSGTRSLIAAKTVEDVMEGLLPVGTRMVGAQSLVLIDQSEKVVAYHGVTKSEADEIARCARNHDPDPNLVRCDIELGSLLATVSAVTPFFGDDELSLLEAIAALASAAVDRAMVLEREFEANERLQRLNELKNEFVAVVAHDLRSPMAVIAGFADTLIDRNDMLDDEQKEEFLKLISRNTKSLANFVEDVLQVARIESGEFSYDLQPFDVGEVVRRTVTELKDMRADVDLVANVEDGLPRAMGDEERNWQILTNLISNAIKFSGEEAKRVCVNVGLDDARTSIEVAVHDNGIGIKESDMPKLFHKFSRIAASEHRSVRGTGLGLYIVKAMVEAQGGSIRVESEPERGSTFTYTVPIAIGGGT
jgi:signal transduction histidine kinase